MTVIKYASFTGFLSYKYNLPADQLTQDFSEFCKEDLDILLMPKKMPMHYCFIL